MSEESTPAETTEAAAPGPSKAPMLLALVNTVVVLAAVGTLYYTKILYKRPAITEDSERKRLEQAHVSKAITEATVPGLVTFEPVTVNIESFPAQPAPTDDSGTTPGSGALQGKLHYATIAFSVEIRDSGQAAAVEEVRPVIMDQLLTLLAHKPFHELTTVQGRYVLRTTIQEMVNHLTENMSSHPVKLVSAVVKAPPKKEGEHGGGEGGEGGGEGGEHGGGEGGEGKKAVKAPEIPGPPIKALYRDGLVSNVFFTQFIVQ